MLITPSGMSILVSEVQEENAKFPMLVTLSGMSIFVSELQPSIAPIPMLVTVYPSSVDGISSSVAVPV